MNKKCIVVIPIHSSKPSDFELISFEQCFKIIKSSKILILHPHGLDLTAYKKVVPIFSTISIDPIKMSSVRAYNKLKLSKLFYNLFKEYDYLLTYELDAFIFRDEIEHWCSLGLDYIGAPWLISDLDGQQPKLTSVGNSGFSLRKISTMRSFVKKYIRYPHETPVGFWNKVYVKILIYTYILFPFIENISIQKFCDENEDIVISTKAPLVVKEYNIGTVQNAMDFSFECHPEYLYWLNSQKLPMGCHAWWRYNLDFWRPFINKQGYNI